MAIFAALADGDHALAEDTFSKNDTRQAIHQIQKRLMKLGYTIGKVDRVWGQKIENVIKKSRIEHGFGSIQSSRRSGE